MTLGEVSRRSRATTANKGAKKSAKHLYRKLLLKFPIDKHQSVILDCIYVQGYRLTIKRSFRDQRSIIFINTA